MSVINHVLQKKPLITTPNRESKFKFKDLHLLSNPNDAYQLSLAVIAHIDLNAFFAQVEQVRLNRSVDDPVVCAQWSSLIAVSYAARKFGIGRMDSIKTAREKCPQVIIAHAAVFKKGNSYWSYVKGLPDQTTHKVLLDPYRRESRKIINIFKEYCDIVEKASVDECFLDFGRLIYQNLLRLFPELGSRLNEDDSLPNIPEILPDSLYWIGEIYGSQYEERRRDNNMEPGNQSSDAIEPDIKDWDDVCLIIGSQLLFEVRCQVYNSLGYTTSGGLGQNKIIAKIAGGFLKPDNQTIIRHNLIEKFLTNFQLNDFNGMGGKVGDYILQKLEVPPQVNSIAYIKFNYTLENLKEEFKPDLHLAQKVYDLVRGNYKQELTLKTDIKSMMSRKNFVTKKPVNTLFDAYDWIKVFAGDLYNRLIELDDESLNLLILQQTDREKGYIRRPKTISLQLASTSYVTHAKQAVLPIIRDLDKLKEHMEVSGLKLLIDLLDGSTNVNRLNNGLSLKELDKQPDKDYAQINIIPVVNMSLVISNFVRNTESSLIDSYVGSKKDDSKNEIRKMFDDFEQESRIKRPKVTPDAHIPTSILAYTSKNEEYVNKLFADYNSKQAKEVNIRNSSSTTTPEPTKTPKDRSIRQEDKDYIKTLFDRFESDSKKNNIGTKIIRKEDDNKGYDILQNLQTSTNTQKSNTSKLSNQSLIDIMMEDKYCPRCNIEVNDILEHCDFHMALDLSIRINGQEDLSSDAAELSKTS